MFSIGTARFDTQTSVQLNQCFAQRVKLGGCCDLVPSTMDAMWPRWLLTILALWTFPQVAALPELAMVGLGTAGIKKAMLICNWEGGGRFASDRFTPISLAFVLDAFERQRAIKAVKACQEVEARNCRSFRSSHFP